jgi:hypothetical protein
VRIDSNVAALKGLADTISSMDDFRSMARDPKHRRSFEKLLYLAAPHGDADNTAQGRAAHPGKAIAGPIYPEGVGQGTWIRFV